MVQALPDHRFLQLDLFACDFHSYIALKADQTAKRAIVIDPISHTGGPVNLQFMDWGWIGTSIEWLGDGNVIWAVVILEVRHLYPIMYLGKEKGELFGQLAAK